MFKGPTTNPPQGAGVSCFSVKDLNFNTVEIHTRIIIEISSDTLLTLHSAAAAAVTLTDSDQTPSWISPPDSPVQSSIL